MMPICIGSKNYKSVENIETPPIIFVLVSRLKYEDLIRMEQCKQDYCLLRKMELYIYLKLSI